ncbi:MAG: carotenoid oxygenase family protein [Actinobacteria bacterium]|nr:carotenoid oxygenase family protein [Actinomycetota bacterium]
MATSPPSTVRFEGPSGTLYRNGPGRWEDHTGRPLHHLFDGDGMISAFRTITGGPLSQPLCALALPPRQGRDERALRTDAVGADNNIGRFPQNLANTNIVEHAGHLYALWEGGPPHEINPETLETLGVRRFSGELRWAGTYSAHPCSAPEQRYGITSASSSIPNPPQGSPTNRRSA